MFPHFINIENKKKLSHLFHMVMSEDNKKNKDKKDFPFTISHDCHKIIFLVALKTAKK